MCLFLPITSSLQQQDVDPPETEPSPPDKVVTTTTPAPDSVGGGGASASASANSGPANGDNGNDGAPATAVKREENINIHNRVRQQRAKNIFAQAIDLNVEFHTPRYPKSDAAVQFIDSALEDNFIFASLTPKERRLLIDAMMLETIPAGTVIIKQGETGDYFYVVEEGHVSFAVDNQHVGSTGRGGSFGELALLCK